MFNHISPQGCCARPLHHHLSVSKMETNTECYGYLWIHLQRYYDLSNTFSPILVHAFVFFFAIPFPFYSILSRKLQSFLQCWILISYACTFEGCRYEVRRARTNRSRSIHEVQTKETPRDIILFTFILNDTIVIALTFVNIHITLIRVHENRKFAQAHTYLIICRHLSTRTRNQTHSHMRVRLQMFFYKKGKS